MLDTLRHVTTPELIELQLRPAGLLPRSLAWTIDFLIRMALLLCLIPLTSGLGRAGGGLWLLAYFLLDWFYPVFFEVWRQGATPGKKALGLMVVNDNGTPVGWGASFSRNLLRVADMLPMAYGCGLVTMLCHQEFRRLGDIVAGTLVVYREKPVALPALEKTAAIAPTEPLDRATQRALLAFAERAASLTPARQEELASLLPQLSQGSYGPQGAARLLGLASHLIGRRT
ncbi:RDD family protein [Uliginosibacterium aquaticum]|uniref:RDD family protein n=1 Tax=Uliginosibacterium aquaticum TaxID=2731212 RepID=A0ABX2IQP3_9RHOO|nr:RDD family protein [Uliginosibacterium aquaticum]NSL57024.1 RDD family protein [Uliginosibacterium aquaticum]